MYSSHILLKVRDEDGRLKAKAIDVDIAMFEKTLVTDMWNEKGNSCSEDEDCNVFCCASKCDQETKKCTGILTTSNLNVRTKFLSRYWSAET